MSSSVVLGIDLGTTHCCVGVYRDGRVHIIPNESGNATTPSYVAFTEDGVLVGESAKSQMSRNPANTIYDTKHIIGSIARDPGSLHYVQRLWPFKLVSDSDGRVKIKVTHQGVEKTYYPEEISAMILSRLKETAESYLGVDKIEDAVITVPANCGDMLRKATTRAANTAGLNVIRLINEPTAAAVTYTHDFYQEDCHAEKKLVVFDLGGGTLDVSILSIEAGICEVLATKGTRVGGEDFTNNLLEYLVNMFRQREKLAALNERAIRRLKRASEETKLALSSQTQVRVELEALFDGRDFFTTVSRDTFEELNSTLFETVIKTLDDAIQAVSPEIFENKEIKYNFEDVLLVGGSSRIPKIQDLILQYFDFKIRVNKRVNLDEAVASGAAIQAAILSGCEAGNLGDLLVLDVCPLSLGVETSGGHMTKIVRVNYIIPCVHCKTFKPTVTANKSSDMHVKVFEGESQLTSENTLLGQFKLSKIPVGLLVEIKFDIDANGSLVVRVKVVYPTANDADDLESCIIEPYQLNSSVSVMKIIASENEQRATFS